MVSEHPLDIRAILENGYRAHMRGEYAEAEACYRTALSVDEKNIDAMFLLGSLLGQQGAHKLAADLLGRVAELAPDHLQARTNLAVSLSEISKDQAAYDLLIEVLGQSPGNVDAINNMVPICAKLCRYDEAVTYLIGLLAQQPWREAELVGAIISNLHRGGRFVEGFEYAERQRKIPGQEMRSLVDFAVLCIAGGMHREAEHFIKQVDLSTTDAYVLGQAAYVHSRLRQFPIAASLSRKGILVDSNLGFCRTNLGMYLLTQGELSEGWREYDHRFGVNSVMQPHGIDLPEWDGRELNGDGVLVHSEQGLGDVFQFMRFFPLMEARGAKVVFASYPDVLTLLKRQANAVTRQNVELSEITYTYQIPIMSLGKVFCNRLEDIPQNVPYLTAPADKVRYWEDRFANVSALKVGLVWAGNPDNINDYLRSATLSDFAPFAGLTGVQFYSLQKGPQALEAGVPPDGMPLVSLSNEIHDFVDTAAIISNLDLVISVDTSVAHLTGAIGKPLWLLLSSISDWRFLDGRSDSPWYPTAQIFRRNLDQSWSESLREVADELAQIVRKKLIESGVNISLIDVYIAAGVGAAQFQASAWHFLSAQVSLDDDTSRALVLGAIRCGAAEWLLEHLPPLTQTWLAYLVSVTKGNDAAASQWRLAWQQCPTHMALQGLVRHDLAQAAFSEAAKTIESACAVIEDNYLVDYLRAQVYRNLGDLAQAEQYYRQALKAVPRWPDALTNLAIVLEGQKKTNEALQVYQYGAARNVSHGPLWLNLGRRLFAERKYTAAELILEHAYHIHPDSTDIAYWFAAALYERSNDHKAHEIILTLLARESDSTRLNLLMAAIEISMGREPEAEARYRHLLTRNPADHVVRMALGMLLLRMAKFEEGWREWEVRTGRPNSDSFAAVMNGDAIQWDGSDLNGRRLVVFFEQGIGDAIQFLRFLDDLDGDVIAIVQDAIYDFVLHARTDRQIVSRSSFKSMQLKYDCYIDAMSIPAVRNLGGNVAARKMPYLHVPGFESTNLVPFDGVLPGLRVGIVWGGNPNHQMDAQRSCPLMDLLPLLRVPGIDWFSLQKDIPSNQAYFLPQEIVLHNAAAQSNSLIDTANFIAGLDLLICVDTALAHLAGAMNKPVWLLLSRRSDWRWGTPDARAEWYPSMRIFQQRELDDWAGLVSEVEPVLKDWASARKAES